MTTDGPRAAVPGIRQVEPGQPSLRSRSSDETTLRFCARVSIMRSNGRPVMSAPVQRDDSLNSDDARLYAPPWARERPLPAAGQPQFTSSPPVASADDPTEESSAPKERTRMPKGVGGPNISWAPKGPPQEAFTGDVAIQALRRRLTLEPDVVPQPPIVVRREAPFPWIARLGFVCLAAGIGAFCITALSVTDFYPPVANKGGDRSQRRRLHAGRPIDRQLRGGTGAPGGRGRPRRRERSAAARRVAQGLLRRRNRCFSAALKTAPA